MRKRLNMILFAATALMCALSFILPGAVLALRDAAREHSTETVEVDEVELSVLSDLDYPQKLTLASDAGAASIPLDGGRVLDSGGAIDAAKEGAAQLELLPSYEIDYSASAFLRVGESGEGAIFWEVSAQGKGETGTLIIDDETGAVLAASVFVDYMEYWYGMGVTGSYYAEHREPPQASAGAEEESQKYQAFGEEEVFETDTRLFHREAGLFLSPLGLDYIMIEVSPPSSATVYIDLGSGELTVPLTIEYGPRTDRISINMAQG